MLSIKGLFFFKDVDPHRLMNPPISFTKTVSFLGIEARPIEVQVQIAPGLPAFQIVGLPDKTVGESKERIRASFYSMGLALPSKRIIVNLAPADLPKEGSHYDVPIALGVLECLGSIPKHHLPQFYIIGELGLDGSLASITGTLPTTLEASSKDLGIICPKNCEKEAIWAGNERVLAFETLLQIINHFKGVSPLPYSKLDTPFFEDKKYPGFEDVIGQSMAKRVLEIAAAGGHNVLMMGTPGAGKSMLSSRFLSILPPMDPKEALETTIIHSLAGLLPPEGIVTSRPFRSPHHSASIPALIGGGQRSKPGEISLSHNGVLFLDEIAEFPKTVLESLRQPIENGTITVSRVNHHMTYPAKFQLIAAMNPCRCGYFGVVEKQCHKVPRCAKEYQNRLSGPLLDRFDLYIYMSPPPLLSTYKNDHHQPLETSDKIKERVKRARAYQKKRQSGLNAYLSNEDVKKYVKLDQDSFHMIQRFEKKFQISTRGFHRILKISRTIADLYQHDQITCDHVSEALQYRLEGLLTIC